MSLGVVLAISTALTVVMGVGEVRLLVMTREPVTVTSDTGKRTEKVLVSKNGDDFVAKRQDEPALYELTASSVTELQKVAADLKPAPPPSKK